MAPHTRHFHLAPLVALALTACVHGSRPSEPTTGGTAWVELGPSGAIARLVTTGTSCPALQLDSGAVPMRERAEPATKFPVRVCEAELPAGARSASIEGQALPLPVAHPRRVVVLGDTGCRLKLANVQACNDPEGWPFPTSAATAAALKPDLVIHVGDFIYRETPCPPGKAGCKGSPWGQDFTTWQADFFQPAAPLLRAAPWVFVRGNHEICARAGEGWFRFLDPRPRPARCEDSTEPWAVPAGDLRFLVLDTSGLTEDEEGVSPSEVNLFRQRFARLGELASSKDWLLAHHPYRAVRDQDGKLADVSLTLQQASGNALPPGVQLILSGHVHLFELLSFQDGRAPQIVAGGGGTKLTEAPEGALAGRALAGTSVQAAQVMATHGFLTFDARDDGTWQVALHAPQGAELLGCALSSGRLDCAKGP